MGNTYLKKTNAKGYTPFITPDAECQFAYIAKADPKYKKFTIQLVFDRDSEALEEFMAEVNPMLDAHFEETHKKAKPALKKKLKKAELVKDLFEYDEEGNEIDTGKVFLKFNTASKPTVVDSQGERVKKIPAIYSGSVVAVAGAIKPYVKEADHTVGLALYLNSVQIIELITQTGPGFAKRDDGFTKDEIEDGDDGYEGDDSGDDEEEDF